MSTCPKLLNQFQPNFTQLFFRALVTILSFNYSGLFGTIRAGIQKHIEANFVTNFVTCLTKIIISPDFICLIFKCNDNFNNYSNIEN